MPARLLRRLDVSRIAVLLGSAVTVAAGSGCSIHAYVSENHAAIAQQVPFRSERPLAREIKFVVADGNIVSGVGGNTSFLVSTNLESKEELNRHGIDYIRQNYQGIEAKHFVSASALTEQVLYQESNLAAKGRAAHAKQAGGQALTLNEAAATQTLGLSKSIDQSVALMNVSIATADALRGWAKVEHEKDARALIDWVTRNTGAVGESAPEGSVLYLDFVRVLEGKSFQFASESDLIVTATLEQPGREAIRSRRAIQLSIYSGGAPSPEQIEAKAVYKEIASPLAKQPEMKPMTKVLYGVDFAALANSAIVDLYEQLASAPAKGR